MNGKRFEAFSENVAHLLMLQAEYRKRGFTEVVSPNLYNVKLWQTSGHWLHYAVCFIPLHVQLLNLLLFVVIVSYHINWVTGWSLNSKRTGIQQISGKCSEELEHARDVHCCLKCTRKLSCWETFARLVDLRINKEFKDMHRIMKVVVSIKLKRSLPMKFKYMCRDVDLKALLGKLHHFFWTLYKR